MSDEPMLAEVENLGEPLDAFKVGAVKIGLFWIGGFVCLLIGLALGALLVFELTGGAGNAHPVAKTLIGAVAFLGGGISMLRTARRSGNMRFLAFEHGLTQLWHDEVRSVRWEAVRVVQRLEDPKNRDRLNNFGDLLSVTAEDGTTLRFGPGIGRFRDLRLLIETQTLPHLLAPATAQMRDQGVVSFGPIQVDAAGVRRSAVCLPWEKLARAYTGKGQVHLCVRGRKRPTLSVPLKEVPNVHVLVALANAPQQGGEPGT